MESSTSSSSSVSFYQDYWHRLQELARDTSRDETAVEQAEAILEELQSKLNRSSSFSSSSPSFSSSLDIEFYNLLWETYAYAAHLPNGAEKIAQQIQELSDNGKSNGRPNLNSYVKLIDAYTQRGDLAKVEAVVEELSKTTAGASRLQPNIVIYNKLIRAYGMLGHADQAKAVVEDLLLRSGYGKYTFDNSQNDDEEKGKHSVLSSSSFDPLLRPNDKTWIHLLRALAREGRDDEIQHYINNVMKLAYHDGDIDSEYFEDWKPNVHAYNALLRALIHQKSQNSNTIKINNNKPDRTNYCHVQAEKLLYEMIQLSREEEKAVVKSDTEKPVRTTSTFDHEDGFQQTDAYSSMRNDGNEEDGEFHFVDGSASLRDSDTDDTTTTSKPNRETFFLVLQSFRGVTDASVADKMERILELQKGLATTAAASTTTANRVSPDLRLLPDTRTYNTALQVLSRTSDPKKAIRAQRLWDAMKSQNIHDSQISDASSSNIVAAARPNLITYRNILNACAYTRGSREDRLSALQIAIRVYNQVRQEVEQHQRAAAKAPTTNTSLGHFQLNHDASFTLENRMMIHKLFLQACFQLMDPSPKRDEVVERVFTKCCQEGLLSNGILHGVVLKQASNDLHLKLLGGFVQDGIEPPSEWSRNVPTPAKVVILNKKQKKSSPRATIR
ncbi:hypothetical protein ACA910_004213 [Epithemia clementina (nom. ined.)]